MICILSVSLAFDTDSYFYGQLPVMIGIGGGPGIISDLKKKNAVSLQAVYAAWDGVFCDEFLENNDSVRKMSD